MNSFSIFVITEIFDECSVETVAVVSYSSLFFQLTDTITDVNEAAIRAYLESEYPHMLKESLEIKQEIDQHGDVYYAVCFEVQHAGSSYKFVASNRYLVSEHEVL